jgi:hypothetical protein
MALVFSVICPIVLLEIRRILVYGVVCQVHVQVLQVFVGGLAVLLSAESD